jgi:hypothetical protein
MGFHLRVAFEVANSDNAWIKLFDPIAAALRRRATKNFHTGYLVERLL